MIGIGWDDLGRGTNEFLDERKFYKNLGAILLQQYDINYTWETDRSTFTSRVSTERCDFVTVDLMSNGVAKGKDIAINVRSMMIQQRSDPDFPVIVLSKNPEEFSTDEAVRQGIILLPKQMSDPAFTAHQIAFRLKESGRFGRSNTVLVLARHRDESLAGNNLSLTALNELTGIVSSASLAVKQVKSEDLKHGGHNAALELQEHILDAGKVIVLLTKDERLDLKSGESIYFGDPNIYFELGMLIGVRGGSRKIILIREKGTYLPPDATWITHIEFSGSPAEKKNAILAALSKLDQS